MARAALVCLYLKDGIKTKLRLIIAYLNFVNLSYRPKKIIEQLHVVRSLRMGEVIPVEGFLSSTFFKDRSTA